MKKRIRHPLDNPNIKWAGSIDYLTDIGNTVYFWSEEENFFKVLEEIATTYNGKNVTGININQTNYE